MTKQKHYPHRPEKPPPKKHAKNAGHGGGHPSVPPGKGDTPPPGEGTPPSDVLGIPGLPPDIAEQIDRIFRSGLDNDAATRKAIQYLMTTPWFAQEYKGYAEGAAKSIFADPFSGGLAQYRAYKNSANQAWKAAYGRDATQDEIANFIGQGWSADVVGQHAQSHTVQVAGQQSWQALAGAFGDTGRFTDEELKAYADEQAGIDSELGLRIKSQVEKAMARVNRVFQGQLATDASSETGLASVLSRQQKSDLGA